MKPDIKEKWITALESGEYRKGKGHLRSGDSFCCLGVLCDLYHKETNNGEWKRIDPSGNVYYFLNNGMYLPDVVCDWAGVIWTAGHVDTLANINDTTIGFDEVIKRIKDTL
jgi:hypothetical protein